MELTMTEFEDLYFRVCNKIREELEEANRNNTISKVLNLFGCENLLINYNTSYNLRSAKILVFGDSQISEDMMKKIVKDHGIRPDRVELRTDYSKNKHYDFSLLKYNSNYSDIIFGPNAHKAVGIDGYSSAIAMMEQNPKEFPKIIKAIGNGELKLTKTSFTKALKDTQLYQNSMY